MVVSLWVMWTVIWQFCRAISRIVIIPIRYACVIEGQCIICDENVILVGVRVQANWACACGVFA